MFQPSPAPQPITYSTAPSGRLICWVVVQEAKIATTERQPKNLQAAFIAHPMVYPLHFAPPDCPSTEIHPGSSGRDLLVSRSFHHPLPACIRQSRWNSGCPPGTADASDQRSLLEGRYTAGFTSNKPRSMTISNEAAPPR